jgi:nucleotide sugar dehydrogenase
MSQTDAIAVVEIPLGLETDLDTGAASGVRILEWDESLDRSAPSHEARAPESPTVAVLGLGYVGLPTSLALLEAGSRVIGFDIDPARLTAIRTEAVDLVPGDRSRLSQALGRPEFVLTTDAAAIALADVVLICVPTPVDEHQLPDLGALRAACATVVDHATPGQTIVLTSTSFVGATRELLAARLEARGMTVGEDVYVAFSPERIDPGNVDFAHEAVPRVVGGVTPICAQRAARVLSLVAPVHVVASSEVAELTKLYENSFRAVNIALANELDTIGRAFGIDASEVVEAASTKPYGFMPFYPGIGVGGHCIPCDPHYLLWQLRAARISAPLLEQAMTGIATRPTEIVRLAIESLSASGRAMNEARILVVGVAYKASVEDIRESPAVELLDLLRRRGAVTEYTDPLVPEVKFRDGRVLRSIEDPSDESYDLIIVHALQPGVGYTWLDGHERVLDPGGVVRRHERSRQPLLSVVDGVDAAQSA